LRWPENRKKAKPKKLIQFEERRTEVLMAPLLTPTLSLHLNTEAASNLVRIDRTI
jgi:hypothetical protein